MNYKALTKEELDYIFEDMCFKTQPMHHQLFSIAFAEEKDRVSFFHGIGTGKSLCALYTHLVWDTQRILIVCPNSVVETTWIEQILQHTNESFIILKGTKQQRRDALQNKDKFFIINYEGLLPLFGSNDPDLVWDDYLIEDANFDGMIIDESHNVKHHDTKHTQICAAVSENCEKTIIMTGTPTLKDSRELWSQYYVLDQGKTLGTNWWAFLNTYFYKYTMKLKRKPWKLTLWGMKDGSEELILNKLRNTTIRVNREDCIDLPEIVYQQINVDMTKEQKEINQKVIDELSSEDIDLHNIINKTEKLRQIAGGFIYLKNGTNFLKQNKTKEILGLIRQIENKVIIFHHYEAEGKILEKVLKKAKIKYASMRGEIKDKKAEYNKFKTDKKCKVLIAHPQSAGTGMNFQDISQTIVFYSSENHLERDQCIGRVYRKNQKNKCLIVDIVCKDSPDILKLGTIAEDKEKAMWLLEYIKEFK